MELEKIRSLGGEELRGEEARMAEQLFRIRFAQSLGKQDGVGKIRGLKKDVARMKTIARERVLAEGKSARQAEPVSEGKES